MSKLILTGSTAAKDDLEFLMIDSTDHVTGKTGLTVTVTLRKPGGSFASPSGAVSEIANGWYRVAANATDNGTVGALLLHATASGADPTDDRFQVVGFDVSDSVRLGLTALPNAAASAIGGLPVAVDTSGRVDVLKINGTSQTARDIGASVLVAGDFSATMKTSLNAATPSVTVSDKTGFSLTQSFPSNFASLGISAGGHISNVDTLTTYTGDTPQTGDVYARVGAGGAGLTALGDTRIAHLDADISSRSTFAGGAVASVTGNVGGNVTGSVGSVTGLTASNLDATISSRLATSGYTAPDNTDILAIKAKTDNLPADPADESLIIAATNSLSASIAALPTAAANRAEMDANSTRLAAIETVTDALPASVATITAQTNLIPGTIDGQTFAQHVTLQSAVLLGKASGLEGTTAHFRALDDSKTRVTATVDVNGNRSAVTLDAN